MESKTGIITIGYNLSCRKCDNWLDEIKDETTQDVIALKCDICNKIWELKLVD